MAATMLTAQQVQDLLDVDASTVYRMAGDGRLPAVRIGRQWRFPAAAIEALLAPAGVPASRRPSGASPGPDLPGRQAGVWTAPAAPAASDAGEASDLGADGAHRATTAGHTAAGSSDELLAPLADEFARELIATIAHGLGVSMVVTDLDGRIVIPVANPAPALAARLGDPDFAAACTVEWRGYAHESHLAPRFQLGRHGFVCAHSLVRQGSALVAMVLAGGIAPDDAGDDATLFHLDAAERRRVLDALPRTAALLSRLATPAAGR